MDESPVSTPVVKGRRNVLTEGQKEIIKHAVLVEKLTFAPVAIELAARVDQRSTKTGASNSIRQIVYIAI